MTAQTSTTFYEANAAALAEQYETVSAELVNGWFAGLLPDRPGLAIDVGAGSGRDAAWLAGRGWQAVAVEPSASLRAEGRRRHDNPAIQWEADRLPALPAITRLGYRGDLVLANAVWMHVPPGERERALRKLVGLTKSGGTVIDFLRKLNRKRRSPRFARSDADRSSIDSEPQSTPMRLEPTLRSMR